MVKHTRPSRKIKDDENNTSKKKVVNGKGFSTSGSATTDTYGLRRSARETSSRKQMISSPSSTRKSERLEKRMPNTPPNKKKHETIERQRMPSPLRRSGRGKEQPSSSCLGSNKSEKRSGSSDMKLRNLKRDKDVKQSTLEGKEIGRSEKKEPEPIRMKKKRMDACTNKALCKQQLRRDVLQDTGEELVSPDKLSQVNSSNGGGSCSKQAEDGEDLVDVGSGRIGEESSEEFVEKACETGVECFNHTLENIDSDMLINKGDKEPDEHSDGDGLDESKIGGIVEDIPNDVQLIGTTSVEVSLDGANDQGSDKEVTLKKRKRNTMDMDSSASTTIACKDTFVADAVYSPSLECKRNIFVRACMACSERRRVDHDSPDQELCLCNATLNKDPCATFIPEDRGELEASVNMRLADKCDDNIQQTEASLGMNTHQNACGVCKLGGKLLCCNGMGCKRSYHHSCLDPPLNEIPPGIWYCLWCVEKKIRCGVLSVSQGIESILDAREVVVSDAEGLRRRMRYFVKYKGLAHIYNRWVPQTQLDFEAPLLVAEFSQNNQATRWKQEWTVPHRLLMKRLLTPTIRDVSNCRYEWLVKWRGLGDDHCTWELENASFLRSPHSQSLVREYENRCEKAKRDSLVSQVVKNKNDYSIKLSKLPAGIPFGLGHNNLKYVNKLREYWHKGRNSVVIDDQKPVMRVVLFILSLLPDVCQPFLIIASSDSISLWEYEFLRLMPSVNVLVYSGNKDTRKNIRTFEFNEESGCIMFQVLISPPEAVVEDFEMLECLKWEAVIVDECQWSGISTHFDQIKILATGVWVLIFNDQIKDSISEYLNVLELLDFCGDLENSGGSKTDSHDNLCELKRRLARFIAYECKDSSRFVEYLVPVWISNVQLEQYCATLLSNSFSLCSTSKKDNVGAFRDILISTRKCCDHPYIVDPSLQGLITKELPEVEYLDVGIKASGKLQLLEMILSNIKDRQLRVVIFFQSIGGSGRDSIGDILDDFLRQRFGPNSYERVDGFVLAKKKQAALNRFNSKDSGKFVFLLENRACSSSIKLSSIDTIIIYNSDWNPSTDLRLLHRVSLDSQFDTIKVFRLYTSYTVEEKVLILAKDDLTLDSNLSRSTSHALLMWGASYLFEKLDQFHCGTISSEESLLKDVVKDFLPLLSQNFEKNEPTSSVILKVPKTGGNHGRNILLFGERKINLTGTEQPHIFWKRLLEGRNPQWKYSSGKLQRNRKRVQYCNHLPDVVEKKPKKLVSVSVYQTSLNPGPGEGEIAGENGVASVISALASGIAADYGSQSLPMSTASLSNTLHMNEASTLSYFSNNMSSLPEVHLVESEKRTLPNMQKSLHTFLKPMISKLCEILQLSEDVKVMAGRFLGYVIDNHYLNSESVTILQAFQISVCWIAASLMKQKIDRKETLVLAKKHLSFSCKEEEANNVYLKLHSLKQSFLCNTEKVTESESEHITINQQSVKLEIDERLQNQKHCENRMVKLQKQREEIRELYRTWEDERVQMEKKHRLESALVRSIHSHIPVRTDKLKVLDNEFVRKLEEHKLTKERRLKDLKAKHLKERKEQIGIESVDPISDSGDLQEERSPMGVLHNVEPSGAIPVDFPQTGPGQEVECNTHVGTSTLGLNPNCENDEVEAIGPDRRSVAGLEQQNRLGNFRDGLESAVLVNQPSEAQISDGARLSMRDQEDPLEMAGKMGASHFMDIMMPDIESDSDDKEGDDSDMSNAVGNLSDTVGGSVDGNSLSTEQSLGKSELVQQGITTPVQGGQLQQNMVLREELSQQSTDTGIQDGDALAGGNQINLQQVEVLELHPIDAGPTDQTNHEPMLLEPVNQRQPHPSTDLPITSFENAEAPLQTVQNPPELSNQLLSPPGAVDLSVGPNQPNSSTGGRIGFPVNPLQNELERLCKDKDQVIKLHEETKLRLRSDCEKEIEDIVAQIRSKYEAKLEDAEATFLLQKKELDTNQNIVLMNKILAQTFRSKYIDLKPSDTLSQQTPRFMQHPRQQTPRPHNVTSSSSAGPPVASQQTTVPPIQAQSSSDLFPRIPTMPPHISLITPTGNVQVRTTRAPAPHIQPFRPSTSMPTSGITSLPRGIPSQQAVSNIDTTSLLVPQPPAPPPPLPAHHSGPYSRLFRTEIAGGSSAFHNSSSSALELVMDVVNRSGAHPHNNLPPVPDLSSNFDSSDLSEFGAPGNVAVDGNNSGVGTGIVCLSDDD